MLITFKRMIVVILKNEFAQLALLNTTEVCSQLHHFCWAVIGLRSQKETVTESAQRKNSVISAI